jgi:hypothetical protein
MKGTSWFRDGISTAQWLIFLLANSLSLPIVVGQLYHLSSTEVAGLLQRTLLVAGLTSFCRDGLDTDICSRTGRLASGSVCLPFPLQ